MTHITIEREALQTVLNALETLVNGSGFAPAESIEKAREAITACQQALAAPPVQEQELAGFVMKDGIPVASVFSEGSHAVSVDGFTWTAQPPAPLVQEPCGWQFYQDGKWHNGMDTNNHRANTKAAGFRVRDVYASPPAAQPAALLTEKGLASACLSYRHDFGLMDETNRGLLMFQAREWARAFGLSTAAAPEKGNT
jgi:hypothetical protein